MTPNFAAVINDSTPVAERHRLLRTAVRPIYSIPGAKAAVRRLARSVIQKAPLSLKNRQRVYNFFASDTSPVSTVLCSARVETGGSLRLNLDLQDDLSRIWYFWGYSGYERGVTRLFQKLAQSKRCIFDVGANIGYYALMAGQIVEGRGEVHAFEPSPHVFRALSANSALNRFESLKINQAAVSNSDGEHELFLPRDAAWTNASLIPDFTTQSAHVPVKTVRLDTYCAEPNISSMDLVKCDVEGGELNALLGMGEMLDASRPDLIIEVLPPYEKALNEFLSSKPYRKFLVTDDGMHEVATLQAHQSHRDYYLSCNPASLA